MRSSVNAPCPCGSKKKYKHCCGPIHRGVPAPSALHLMRARYSAYAVGKVDFLIDTTHPDNPQFQSDRRSWANDIERFCDATEFLGLEILLVESGEPYSFIVFRASLDQQGRDASFSERSRFTRLDGHWVYLDGDAVF